MDLGEGTVQHRLHGESSPIVPLLAWTPCDITTATGATSQRCQSHSSQAEQPASPQGRSLINRRAPALWHAAGRAAPPCRLLRKVMALAGTQKAGARPWQPPAREWLVGELRAPLPKAAGPEAAQQGLGGRHHSVSITAWPIQGLLGAMLRPAAVQHSASGHHPICSSQCTCAQYRA